MNKCNRRSWVESWHCLKSPDCTIGMTDGQPGGILRPVAAFFGQTKAPASDERMFFVTRAGTIATFGAGRFRSANPRADGLWT